MYKNENITNHEKLEEMIENNQNNLIVSEPLRLKCIQINHLLFVWYKNVKKEIDCY